MKATKPISDLIDEPRADVEALILEMTNEHIEVKGYSSTQLQTTQGKYHYIDLSDTNFTDSVLSNVSTFRSTVVRCVISKSQMTGLQLPEGNFKHVIFKNCRMNLTNFRNSVFENCIFEDCDLTEADFIGSKFTNVLFKNCQVDDADFSNCENKRLEFEDTPLGFIKGINGLRHALIKRENLIELADLMARELEITINE